MSQGERIAGLEAERNEARAKPSGSEAQIADVTAPLLAMTDERDAALAMPQETRVEVDAVGDPPPEKWTG